MHTSPLCVLLRPNTITGRNWSESRKTLKCLKIDLMQTIMIMNTNQYIPGGGSGKCFTMQVKFIVEPVSMYMSGPPMIVVMGSVLFRCYKQQLIFNFHVVAGAVA
jgi:hypothetical protein